MGPAPYAADIALFRPPKSLLRMGVSRTLAFKEQNTRKISRPLHQDVLERVSHGFSGACLCALDSHDSLGFARLLFTSHRTQRPYLSLASRLTLKEGGGKSVSGTPGVALPHTLILWRQAGRQVRQPQPSARHLSSFEAKPAQSEATHSLEPCSLHGSSLQRLHSRVAPSVL